MVRKRLSLAAVIAIAALMCVVIAACGSDDDSSGSTSTAGDASSEVTKVRMGIVPSLGAVPIFVAQREGLFERNDLEVEVLPGPNATAMIPAVGRQYDAIGAVPWEFIQAAARGIDITALVGLSVDVPEKPAVSIIAGKDTGIETPADLTGKTIGVIAIRSSADTTTKLWLQENGVDPDSVRFVEVPFDTLTDQLNAGRVDAVFSAQPFAAQLTAQGHKSLGSPWQVIGSPPIRTSFVAASGQWVEDNPEAAARFHTAIEEAVALIARDEQHARTALVRDLQLPAEIARGVPLNEWEPELTGTQFSDWIAVMEGEGALEGTTAPDPDSLLALQ